MILLSCEDLSKSFGARPLFTGLSFGLFEGERTGMIGPNGAGKSTLLRILAGLETPDEGKVAARRGLRVGYLPQQDSFEAGLDQTVSEAAARALNGLGLEDYELDMRVEAGLAAAGFDGPHRKVEELSGGWRKRLAILGQVMREPDLLLLDEPTNHLDLEGVLWLEGFLSDYRFPFLVVTHDRRFLEKVCNRIIEVDRQYEDGHFSSQGGYSDFLEKREELLERQGVREERLRNTVRGEIAWLRRGPKARTTKQQARIDRAGELMGELGELEYRNAQGRAADIDFSGSERMSKSLLRAVGIEKSLGGRKLFGPLDVSLGPGDRLGLLGENGSGKTTLLDVLAGKLAPDKGLLKPADALKIVVFDQRREQLELDMPLKRALCPAGEHVEYKGNRIHVYGWGARFLFRQEQMSQPLRMLSGGEQSRVLIAQLMLQPADVLLLDEPTNDLDLQSLEVLESSMLEFPGALVLVTHDRYLLDRVSKELLALDGRGGARYYADLSQWEAWRQAQPPKPGAAAAPAREPKRSLSAQQAKELRGLEASVRAAEQKAAKARARLEDPAVATDPVELHKRQQDLEAAQRRVDELFARWEELEGLR